MKNIRLFLSIVSILIGLGAFSQNIVEENKIWSVRMQPSEGIGYYTEQTTFKGDTLIDGKTYLKVLTSKTEPAQWSFNYWVVREENNVVYKKFIYPGSEKNEQVLYNFNLVEGDTFDYIYDGGETYKLKVDSVIFEPLPGFAFKTWYITVNEGYQIQWVDTIGNPGMVLDALGMLVGAFNDLLCVGVSGELYYSNPNFNSCYISSNITDIPNWTTRDKLIVVYASQGGRIQIELLNSINGEIQFYDIRGKLINTQTVSNAQTELCVPQTGLMIYLFINQKGEQQSGKLIAY